MYKIVFFLITLLLSSMTLAEGEPFEIIDVDRSSLLEQKHFLLVKTDSGPIWIIPRTQTQIEYLITNPVAGANPEDPYRSIIPEYFVVKPICQCSGTLPQYFFPDEGFLKGVMPGGFYCALDQSLFDMSGRIITSNCGATDFLIPEYEYLDDGSIKVYTGDT